MSLVRAFPEMSSDGLFRVHTYAVAVAARVSHRILEPPEVTAPPGRQVGPTAKMSIMIKRLMDWFKYPEKGHLNSRSGSPPGAVSTSMSSSLSSCPAAAELSPPPSFFWKCFIILSCDTGFCFSIVFATSVSYRATSSSCQAQQAHAVPVRENTRKQIAHPSTVISPARRAATLSPAPCSGTLPPAASGRALSSAPAGRAAAAARARLWRVRPQRPAGTLRAEQRNFKVLRANWSVPFRPRS